MIARCLGAGCTAMRDSANAASASAGRSSPTATRALSPASLAWSRRVADLPPGPCHERQPEDRIAGVDLERSEASQHVARQQVVPGLAGSVDCQTVVGPCRANVAHVCVQPCGQARCLAERRSHPADQR